ncbi:MAG: AsmA family protein [Pseudomonadota bacterium]
MNNLLLWVAGLLVAGFAALFAVPPLVDWNQFRGVFEEEASRLLGREVRVGGSVNLRILPVPYVSFEKVSISDAPGLPGAFLRAERFTMLLSAPPLLRGVMEARQLEIESPEITLRFNENGGGNWQQLEIRERELAFVPTDVSLQSAMIKNGRILLISKDGNRVADLEKITGELSAKGLRGPYKFNGSLNIGKNQNALRISTASMDAKGQLRFKLSSRSAATKTHHKVDGQIQDLATAPRVSGKLEARGPVRLGKGETEDTATFYDMNAQLNLNTSVAELSDMSVSFDSAGRPQLLVGAARATWDGGLKLSSKLSSQWLDLDAISAGKTRKSPIEALAFLTGDAIDTGPQGSSNLQIELEQASLGGEVVSGLNVRLLEKAGKFHVDHISALLPGRTQFRANGQVRMLESGLGGDGQLLLNGRSLDKFLGWLQLETGELKGRAAGAFEFSADVSVAPKKVAISDARMRFASGDSRGSFEFDWSETPRIKLQADGDHIDVSGLGARLLAPESIAYVLGIGQPVEKKPSPALQFLSKHDLDLDLNVRDMTDGEQTLTDVGIRMSRTGRAVRFSRSRLTFQPGLDLEIEGNVDSSKDGAIWDLSGLIDVQDPRALGKLHGLVGDIIKQSERPRFLFRTAPLAAAFVTKATNEDGQWNSALSLDGTLGTDRLRVSVNSKGRPGQWRDNPLQADLKIDGYAETALLKLLNWERSGGPGRSGAAEQNANGITGPVPSLFRLRLSGIPKQELTASAALAGNAWQLRLKGKGKPGNDKQNFRWAGSGWVQAGEIGQAVRTVAPGWLDLVRAGGGVEGDFHFKGQPGQWSVEPIQVMVGTSQVSGQLDLVAAQSRESRPKVSGRLNINQIDAVPIYLALLKGERPFESPNAGNPTDTEPQPIWPDSPFNLAALRLFDANVSIGTSSLKLSPALVVSNVSSQVNIESGVLDVKLSKGRLLGGGVVATGRLSPEQAGAKLAINLTLKDALLRRVASGGLLEQKLKGRADIDIAAEGQALSPRALAIALTGKGTARIKSGRVPGLASTELTQVADSIVLAETNAEDIGNVIDGRVTNGTVNVGNQSMKLALRDGTLTMSPFVVRSGDIASASNRTSFDLVRGVIDSQWDIPTRLNRAIADGVDPQKPLPPVRITYSGVLGELAKIAPRVSIGDLQRELTVQRMENDVRRLERQRREDEARAQAETERLRRLERERLEALEEERRKRRLNLPQPAAVPVNPQTAPIPGQPQVGAQPLSNGNRGTVERQALPPVTPGQSVPNAQQPGAALPNAPSGPIFGPQGAGLQQPVEGSNQAVAPPLPSASPPRPKRVRPPRREKFDPFNQDSN